MGIPVALDGHPSGQFMMRSFMRFFATLFLLLALFMASDIGPMAVAEARTCETESHRFSGVCLSASNCAAVCQTEGFTGGDCRGFRRRCFCTKAC